MHDLFDYAKKCSKKLQLFCLLYDLVAFCHSVRYKTNCSFITDHLAQSYKAFLLIRFL